MKERSTRARQAIKQIFRNHPTPLSLAEIHRYVKVSLPLTAYSTVFRIVLALEKSAQVTRIDWRERGSRYEWSGESHHHHHHIICQLCGTVVDLNDTEVSFDEHQVGASTGFIMKRHSIELEGICPRCQQSQKTKL